MKTTKRTIRLHDHQVAALDALAKELNISGQRDATLNPLIAWLADAYEIAPKKVEDLMREIMNCLEVNMYQIIYTTVNEDMVEETQQINVEIEPYFNGFRWCINSGQWCRTNEQGNGVFVESKNGIEQTTGTMQASFVSERQLITWLQDKLVPAWAIDQQLIPIESLNQEATPPANQPASAGFFYCNANEMK